MDDALQEMISEYERTDANRENNIREVLQRIALASLSRSDFFSVAAFYGGTSLRLFHGLDRFSEDLDFSLMRPDPDFDLSPHLTALERDANAFGLNLKVSEKTKSIETNVKTAHIKGNYRELVFTFYPDELLERKVDRNRKLTIKMDLDIDPPRFARYAVKNSMLPYPYMVRIYDMPSLFASKIHAILCRNWINRVKGRDLYDFLFYLTKKTKVNMHHLEDRLNKTGCAEGHVTIGDIREMLRERFDNIDFESAKEDARTFVSDEKKIEGWTAELFKTATDDVREAN